MRWGGAALVTVSPAMRDVAKWTCHQAVGPGRKRSQAVRCGFVTTVLSATLSAAAKMNPLALKKNPVGQKPRCAKVSRREQRVDARGVAKEVKLIMNPKKAVRVYSKAAMVAKVNKTRAAAQMKEDAAEWVVTQPSPRRSPRKRKGALQGLRKIGAAAAVKHFGYPTSWVRACFALYTASVLRAKN